MHAHTHTQFYRSHFDLISRYSKSVTQHLREGVDSQGKWTRRDSGRTRPE